MMHRHDYRPVSTTTLTLPERTGHYDILMIFRCPCGRTAHVTANVRQQTAQHTLAELSSLARRRRKPEGTRLRSILEKTGTP